MMYKVLSTIFEKFLLRIMTNRSGIFSVLLILFLSNTQILDAQNIPNLDVQIVTSPTSARIGSTIGITVLVSNVGNQNVAAAENISVTVELQDPSGNVVRKSDGSPIKHIQILNGLGIGATAVIANDPTNQVLLQIPWSEGCLLYTSPSPRDQRGSRMPSSA